VTNTTSRSRTGLVERLRGYGYDVRPEEIITPARAAVGHCIAKRLLRISAYISEMALEDLEGLELQGSGRGGSVDAVIIGDLGERWSFALMQQAFTQIMSGAEVVALSKDRYFQKAGTLTLDAGPFVAGLEYATGKAATVVGKPSSGFYRAAIASLGIPESDQAGEVVMVGDDLWSDIAGAQRAGLKAWLVRTGKFREEKLRQSEVVPDRIIESVGELSGVS
jgi:HAD superfamily hydrolase (TIGR01458 family)